MQDAAIACKCCSDEVLSEQSWGLDRTCRREKRAFQIPRTSQKMKNPCRDWFLISGLNTPDPEAQEFRVSSFCNSKAQKGALMGFFKFPCRNKKLALLCILGYAGLHEYSLHCGWHFPCVQCRCLLWKSIFLSKLCRHCTFSTDGRKEASGLQDCFQNQTRFSKVALQNRTLWQRQVWAARVNSSFFLAPCPVPHPPPSWLKSEFGIVLVHSC